MYTKVGLYFKHPKRVQKPLLQFFSLFLCVYYNHGLSLFVPQALSDSSQGEFDDTEILHLQERASSLLLRG